jgi:crotonobetainyl-CoA:carnitine CoA-transferase CaiB-like acyl-CoA transferase
MTTPLDGLRVLDLSRVLAGPYAAQTLADLGAEVIKVERPGTGDDTRHWGPPYARTPDGSDSSLSAYYLSLNRSKSSITVNIASSVGQQIIKALAQQSDVVIENYKVGQLARYGLDAASLRRLNPRLIYCSITGFGQSGPYASQPGYDFVVQGMGGLMSITGNSDSQPGGGPMKCGVAIADLIAGQSAVIAILAALNRRHATGKGETIDIALLDCQVSALLYQAMNYLTSGVVPARIGNAHPNIVPYEAFATADGHIIIAVGNDGQFKAFAALAGHPEWADDARFRTNPVRVANRVALSCLINDVLKARTGSEWLALCAAAGVPAGPINSIDAVFDDPQVIHRGLRLDLPHDELGSVPSIASPLRFEDAAPAALKAPPALGEHTDGILRQRLGLDDEAIARLRNAGIV